MAELWQGNTGALKVGRKAWAHDPACWYGHSEFDLALSGLFGGFLPYVGSSENILYVYIYWGFRGIPPVRRKLEKKMSYREIE